ncbi:MAG TPA: hypothetical protein VIJ38_07400 [Acidobacteriaceae bacterium]
MFDTSVEELIDDLTKRIRQMSVECKEDVDRLRDECRQRERDRFRRYDDEAYHLIRQRDAFLKTIADIEATKPLQVILTK